MKKQHFLPAFIVMFFGLSLVFMSSYVAAQNAADDNKQVKVKIKQNINGESKTIEKFFSENEEEAIQELLKEFDINLNADDLDGEREVEINIRKIKENTKEDNVIVEVERIGGGESTEVRPFLGVYTETSQTDNANNSTGVRVTEVIPGSSAEQAGLKDGDVIKKLNNKTIEKFDALREVLGSLKVGDEVKIEFEREGKTTSATAKLGSRIATEKMCLHFDEGKMQNCAERRTRELDKESQKERLQDEVQEMEKEIQILKKRIEMIDSNEGEILEKTGAEETTISITIEDVAPNTLAIEGLQLTPNPNHGKFNLSFELPQKGKTVVRIFDASNKEIYKEDLGKFSGRYNQQIDISENPKGIYFLQITQNDKAMNKKIVIQ